MKRALLILLLLLGVTAGPASAAIDPFYRSRMETGVRAFEQGNWEAAAYQLRIACFGYLDEPAALVEGLARLAIVEAKLGREEAFRQTFSRLVELEDRFAAFSAAALPATVREELEGLAARLVPVETLRASAGFRAIADRAEIQRLAGLPPAARRAGLTARLEAEPERPRWLLEMARLELAVRQPQPALDWLDRLPPATAALPPATCMRQQAASETRDCARMDLTHPFCREVPAAVVAFRLECLIDAGRGPEAAALVAGLDPELRAGRRVARLERRLRKILDASEPAGDGDPELVAAPPPATTPMPPPAPPAAAADQPADAPETRVADQLAELRRRLAAAASRAELFLLLGDAEELATRYPAAREARLLAAEIAYLRSDWGRAVDHFRQAGGLAAGEAHLVFYLAVALFESGEPAAAAETLRPVVPRLERSPFVDAYLERILGPGI